MTPNSGMRRNSARLRQLANYLREVPSERVGISLRRLGITPGAEVESRNDAQIAADTTMKGIDLRSASMR
ncbi:MAG: hypothetical protein QF750_07670 [Prochlorococcaceae cyanobacterium ETNP14_MAG_5]|nr:hypothetical protein [Prochlorococcaceae cyanobacterium ETNP14_MAG_5]